jgi:hypothetical protein
MKHLNKFIKQNRVPGKLDCLNCIKKSGQVLKNRDWSAVKYCVYNIIARAKKRLNMNK